VRFAVNGSADFREGFGPLLADTTEIPFGDLGVLIRELKRGDVAAFIVEPIQGKGVYELEAELGVSSRTPCTPPGRCLFAMRCKRAS